MSFAECRPERSLCRPVVAMIAALCLGVAGCDDGGNKSGSGNAPPDRQQAQTTPSKPQTTPTPPAAPPRAEQQPPPTAPGARPSAARLVGTWTVTQAQGMPPGESTRSDRAETTTYRFEEGGRVTVAGAKQCAYSLDAAELKVDCQGKVTSGKVEFRGDQIMVWTVGANQTITLTKR